MLKDIPDKGVPGEGAVARTPKEPSSIRFAAPAPMALVMFTPQPDQRIAVKGYRDASGMPLAGSLEIVPARVELHAPWNVEKQNLLLAVDSRRLERLAGVGFNRETFELHLPKLDRIDSKAHQLARWIQYEIENKKLSLNECVDALITVFATHLMRPNSPTETRSMRHSGGLPPAIWRRVDDFINSNLSGSLSLERLARVARLSSSHFARAFKQTTGQSPHRYVISARLAHARNLIVSTDAPLGQIAKTAGFSSNSHMTTLMRRAWHCTPTDLRKRRQGLAQPTGERSRPGVSSVGHYQQLTLLAQSNQKRRSTRIISSCTKKFLSRLKPWGSSFRSGDRLEQADRTKRCPPDEHPQVYR